MPSNAQLSGKSTNQSTNVTQIILQLFVDAICEEKLNEMLNKSIDSMKMLSNCMIYMCNSQRSLKYLLLKYETDLAVIVVYFSAHIQSYQNRMNGIYQTCNLDNTYTCLLIQEKKLIFNNLARINREIIPRILQRTRRRLNILKLNHSIGVGNSCK